MWASCSQWYLPAANQTCATMFSHTSRKVTCTEYSKFPAFGGILTVCNSQFNCAHWILGAPFSLHILQWPFIIFLSMSCTHILSTSISWSQYMLMLPAPVGYLSCLLSTFVTLVCYPLCSLVQDSKEGSYTMDLGIVTEDLDEGLAKQGQQLEKGSSYLLPLIIMAVIFWHSK